MLTPSTANAEAKLAQRVEFQHQTAFFPNVCVSLQVWNPHPKLG